MCIDSDYSTVHGHLCNSIVSYIDTHKDKYFLFVYNFLHKIILIILFIKKLEGIVIVRLCY